MSGSSANFGVQAVVDIYPYEGGQFTLTSSNGYLRGASTAKSVSGDAGSFSLTLSPGGPNGTTRPTWSQILTPLSLVVIAFMRGAAKQIVMLGVVTNVTEQQQWGDSTQRVTLVSGMDLTYFFVNTNYYNLTYLFGDAASALPGPSMLAATQLGLAGGVAPAQVGSIWYNTIMTGSEGVLVTTTFNFRGNTLPFKNIFGTLFQPIDTDTVIPMAVNFLADEGSWMGKFQSFFQYPWYEFFIDTAIPGTYHETEAISVIPSSSSQFDAVSAIVVARINPLPKLTNTGSNTSTNFSVDLTRWNALPVSTVDTANFFSSQASFTASDVRNFYMINPVNASQLYGGDNGSIAPFPMTQLVFKDQGSVNRYGYLPQVFETQWFIDPNGVMAQQNAANGNFNAIQTLVNDLLTRAVGVVHPLVLMASATVTMSLRPDIRIGTVFQYIPFKDGTLWDFYIESVSHSFPFGAQATTTLVLSRGLPHTVYQTPKLLTAILTGTAVRQNGSYTTSTTPALPGIIAVTFDNAGSQNTGFSQPQGGQQPGTP
jgi:hypothetical protein